MRVWLRLTSLFGLPDDEHPENLMAVAIGPIIRAAGRDLSEAPLPLEFQQLLDELRRSDRVLVPRKNGTNKHPELTAQAISNGATNEHAIVQHP